MIYEDWEIEEAAMSWFWFLEWLPERWRKKARFWDYLDCYWKLREKS